MKIPNILTIGRIIIVPIFVLSFFIPGVVGDLVPFFLFILASFTDFLDGLLVFDYVALENPNKSYKRRNNL